VDDRLPVEQPADGVIHVLDRPDQQHDDAETFERVARQGRYGAGGASIFIGGSLHTSRYGETRNMNANAAQCSRRANARRIMAWKLGEE